MEIMKLFAHIIVMVALMEDCQAQSQFVTEAASRPLACKDPNNKTPGTYFDTNVLRCVRCPANTKPNADATGCECAAGFKRVPSPAQAARMKEAAKNGISVPSDYFLADFLPTCEQCPKITVNGKLIQTAPSQDKSACLSCDEANGVEYKNEQCQCLTDGHLVQTFDQNGGGSFSCQACPSGSFRGPREFPIYECQACQVEGMGYDSSTSSSRANCRCGKGDALDRWGGEYVDGVGGSLTDSSGGEKCVREVDVEETARQYQASVSVEYRAVKLSTVAG